MLHNTLTSLPDLRHRLRQWRWFRMAFHRHAGEVRATFGIGHDIDDVALARAFFNWLEALDGARTHSRIENSDLVVFAAGMLLRELLRESPAENRAGGLPAPLPEGPAELVDIARFWPEGFLYASFCIFGTMAVEEQETGEPAAVADCIEDIRFWWSFKENAAEMPSLAIPFLHRMVGREPNWVMPETPTANLALLNTARRSGGGSIAPIN